MNPSDAPLGPGGPSADFGRQLLELYTGAALSLMIVIGYQTGLFDAAATAPATAEELAERAQLEERYVREWLGAMASGGIMSYDPPTGRYSLPPERAAFLTGATIRNAAPQSQVFDLAAPLLPEIIACFRQGGGVPYSRFRPAFTRIMDDNWRRIYDDQLIGGFLPAARGLPARLRTGIRAADVGCGTGHALNLMAREYLASAFVGYDLAEDATAAARHEATTMDLANVRFEVQDIAALPSETRCDLIMAFDAIHDQARPDIVLRAIAQALAPDGIFFMVEHKFSSDLAANLANPYAPLYYSLSTLHCLTVSLAEGGPGWGRSEEREPPGACSPTPASRRSRWWIPPRPQNAIFVCRKHEV